MSKRPPFYRSRANFSHSRFGQRPVVKPMSPCVKTVGIRALSVAPRPET